MRASAALLLLLLPAALLLVAADAQQYDVQEFDADDSGILEPKEFTKFLQGTPAKGQSKAQVRDMFKTIDTSEPTPRSLFPSPDCRRPRVCRAGRSSSRARSLTEPRSLTRPLFPPPCRQRQRSRPGRVRHLPRADAEPAAASSAEALLKKGHLFLLQKG